MSLKIYLAVFGVIGELQAVLNIQSIFVSGLKIGTSSSEPRTTRVGLVTYNSGATVAADLNKYQSLDDLQWSTICVDDNIGRVTVILANRSLNCGRAAGKAEFQYQPRPLQKLIIVYASDYE